MKSPIRAFAIMMFHYVCSMFQELEGNYYKVALSYFIRYFIRLVRFSFLLLVTRLLSIFRQTAQSVSRGHVISADPVDSWMHGRFHYHSSNKSLGHNQGTVTGEGEIIILFGLIYIIIPFPCRSND